LEGTTVDGLLAFTCVAVVNVTVGEHHNGRAVGVYLCHCCRCICWRAPR
jgi:hypothetical protein